jgi:hypothetical protein
LPTFTGAFSLTPDRFSAKDLTDRWHCARSSVDRITRRAGMKRLCLGEGKNGMIRFLRKEVEDYEQKQLI